MAVVSAEVDALGGRDSRERRACQFLRFTHSSIGVN